MVQGPNEYYLFARLQQEKVQPSFDVELKRYQHWCHLCEEMCFARWHPKIRIVGILVMFSTIFVKNIWEKITCPNILIETVFTFNKVLQKIYSHPTNFKIKSGKKRKIYRNKKLSSAKYIPKKGCSSYSLHCQMIA